MSLFSISGIRLAGLSACVPKNEISNHDFELINPKERELLIRATGIEKRRVAAKGVCTSDLCLRSAEALIEKLKWEKEEINVLVFVTQTPDYITPATSSLLQSKLGLSTSCIALDINLGCSGYIYGFSVVASLLKNFKNGKGLLLVGDISTACISDKDKSTTPIFSDAGSATAITSSEGEPPIYFNLEGDGSGFKAIIIPDGGYRNPYSEQSLAYQNFGEGISRNNTHLILNGIDIYNFSVKEVPPNVEALLKFSNQTKGKTDYFIFHQANLLINEAIRKKLKLEPGQVPYSLKDFGNTSSATIPVTMLTQIRNELKTRQLSLVLSGFGVGLSWSSMFLQTDRVVCTDLVEY